MGRRAAWRRALQLRSLTREPVLGQAAAAVHPREGEARQASGAAQARGSGHGGRAYRGLRNGQRAVRGDTDHAARTHAGAPGQRGQRTCGAVA